MRKKEYWETRPYPKVIWHWTATEFMDFLVENGYPSNTLRDREEIRVISIRSALVRGDYIPSEVMQDKQTDVAILGAEMEIKAGGFSEFVNQEEGRNRLLFEKEIGWMHSVQEYRLRLGELLTQAARTVGREPDGGPSRKVLSEVKVVGLDGLPFNLTISLRSSDLNGSARWLEIRDSRCNDISFYGCMRRVSFWEAESIFGDLLREGIITVDEARTVMGASWQPCLIVTKAS